MYIVFPGTSSGADRVIPQGNREEYAAVAVKRVKKALSVDKQSLSTRFEATTDEILEAAEVCVNILECCEIVPMDNLLSARLFALRDIPEEKMSK